MFNVILSLKYFFLSYRYETRRVSSTNTWSTVLCWFVCQTKLAQIVTNHFGLDFDLIERLTIVYGNHAADHFGNDNRVT